MLHPVFVVTIREVFTSMSPSRFLACRCRFDSLNGALENVAKFEGLNKIRVPDHAPVLDTDIIEALVDSAHLLNTLVKRLLCAENSCIRLHGLLHLEPDLRSRLRAIGSSDLVQELYTSDPSFLGNSLMRFTGFKSVSDVVSNSTTKYDNVQKRVRAQTVSTMNRDTGSFTSGVKSRNNIVLAIFVDGDDLTSIPSRNATHVVVDSG